MRKGNVMDEEMIELRERIDAVCRDVENRCSDLIGYVEEECVEAG